MNKKVELQVIDITESQNQVGAYALILNEKEGNRQIPIIIGAAEAQATAICLKDVKTPRPLTHDLFHTCIDVLGAKLLRVLIYRVEEGVFSSYIYLKQENNIIRIDARTSDAVALALRANAPVFIYEAILAEECIKTCCKPSNDDIVETIDMTQKVNDKALEKALQKAIKEENYELAACLRDELNKNT